MINKIKVNNYPTKKVISCFVIFGGMIGGLFLTPTVFLMDINNNHSTSSTIELLTEFFSWLYVFGGTGIFWGFLPALLTSMFVVNKKMYLVSYIDYVRLFRIGCLMTLPCFIFLFLISIDGWEVVMILFILMVNGGLSSIFVGHFTIPKVNHSK